MLEAIYLFIPIDDIVGILIIYFPPETQTYVVGVEGRLRLLERTSLSQINKLKEQMKIGKQNVFKKMFNREITIMLFRKMFRSLEVIITSMI